MSEIVDMPGVRINALEKRLRMLEAELYHHSSNRSNPHLLGINGLENGLADGGNLLGVNLIKNYPSLESANGTAPEWWGSTNCTITEEDATGESLNGTQSNERIIKCVTSASGGRIWQSFTTTNERLLVASETVVSLGVWVYLVTAGTLTFQLYDSVDAELANAVTTKTGAWVYLEIPAKTIGANIQYFMVRHSANPGTFYIANPVLNVGSSVIPFKTRGLRFREKESFLVTNVDPGGAGWTNVDCTADGGANAVFIEGTMVYLNASTAGKILKVRRNGSTATGLNLEVLRNPNTSTYFANRFKVLLDDGNIFQYNSDAVAGDTEDLYIASRGYWEWE